MLIASLAVGLVRSSQIHVSPLHVFLVSVTKKVHCLLHAHW